MAHGTPLTYGLARLSPTLDACLGGTNGESATACFFWAIVLLVNVAMPDERGPFSCVLNCTLASRDGSDDGWRLRRCFNDS